MGKNAVTIIELLVVVIIIGILAAIAVPSFTLKIERTRGERAIANIEIIVSACKMYAIKYEVLPSPLPSTLAEINSALNLELTDTYFNYKIEEPSYVTIEAEYKSDATKKIQYNWDPGSGDPDDWDYTNSTWQWMPPQHN